MREVLGFRWSGVRQKFNVQIILQTLLKCNWCELPFQEGDKFENDHILPTKAGGSNKQENRQLLHKHCHDIKTKSDLLVIKQYKLQKEWNKTLKQFNHLDWEWVDDIPTLVKGTHKEPDSRGAQ